MESNPPPPFLNAVLSGSTSFPHGYYEDNQICITKPLDHSPRKIETVPFSLMHSQLQVIYNIEEINTQNIYFQDCTSSVESKKNGPFRFQILYANDGSLIRGLCVYVQLDPTHDTPLHVCPQWKKHMIEIENHLHRFAQRRLGSLPMKNPVSTLEQQLHPHHLPLNLDENQCLALVYSNVWEKETTFGFHVRLWVAATIHNRKKRKDIIPEPLSLSSQSQS